MKEKKDRILFNYFIIGFEIFIFICLEGMIYPVRNTDEYYWGGYQYFSFICSPTKDLGAFLLERGIRMVFFMVAMSTDSPSL